MRGNERHKLTPVEEQAAAEQKQKTAESALFSGRG